MSIFEQVEAARAGCEPALIGQVLSGWVVLGRRQYLRGYCLLLPDPVVSSLNDLTLEQRAGRVPFDGPWAYPQETKDSMLFDCERDRDLMCRLREAISKRSKAGSMNVKS